MRHYEMMVITHPDLAEEAIAGTIDTIQGWIADSEGKVVKVDNWGRRKFAYPINRLKDGTYLLFDIELKAPAVAELDRKMHLSDDILRHLVVRLEDE